MKVTTTTKKTKILTALDAVKDPEIPVISVVDLGIITNIAINEKDEATITMTPTFTACPAIKIMQQDIKSCVEKLDFIQSAEVVIDYAIPWTSDRMSERGKRQIKAFGIAPPATHHGQIDESTITYIRCPHCDSDDTSMKALFGPTLCRSMHYCYNCQQAFQAFKPI
jgi:ring-1,2-phenylacetyl-CoA epoxidase subunit PaaD